MFSILLISNEGREALQANRKGGMAARCERRRNRAVVGMLSVLIINKGRDSRGGIMINKVENSLSLSFLINREKRR